MDKMKKRNAIENPKEIAKTPYLDSTENAYFLVCPVCEHIIIGSPKDSHISIKNIKDEICYCEHCGQRLSWESYLR